jgi:hypothetical protein
MSDIEVSLGDHEIRAKVQGEEFMLSPDEAKRLQNQLKLTHDEWKREGMGGKLEETARRALADIDGICQTVGGLRTSPEHSELIPVLRLIPEQQPDKVDEAQTKLHDLSCRIRDMYGPRINGIRYYVTYHVSDSHFEPITDVFQ